MALSRRNLLIAAAAMAGCSTDRSLAQGGDVSERGPLMTREIPSTGEALPIVGLGTWQAFDIAPGGPEWPEAREALRVFVDGGGTVVDSSPMYRQSEAAIGAIAAELELHPKLFIATKVWTRGREAGIQQMEESRQKIGAPVIDLMQVHNLRDLETHMPTLQAWKVAGRIRYLGVTHYNDSAYGPLEAAMGRHTLDFVQINASVVEREAEKRILPLARERGMAVLINRPFAAGGVFSRVRQLPLPDWAVEIGAVTWAQVLLKYVLANPAVTCVIPRTRNPRHVADNLGAGVGALPDAVLRRRIVEAVTAA